MTKYKHGSAKRITKGMVFWCSDGSKDLHCNPEGGPSKLPQQGIQEENNDPPKKPIRRGFVCGLEEPRNRKSRRE
jgi:hypothetical protein